jgi:opacity protein-like surface antigen
MKKFMMIAAMMVAAVSANAQFEPGTFSIQPKAGLGVSWLSNMPDLPLDQAGLQGMTLDKSPIGAGLIGVEFEYQLAPKFSLAAGVDYALQGSGWKDTDIYSTADGKKHEISDAKLELGYVHVPVTANLYLFNGFAVKAGVQFGFLTNASSKAKEKVDNTSMEADVDIKDGLKKVDISIPLGVSYQFKVPITLDLRYNLGLTKVNKESDPHVKDFKNNSVMLTVGYKFAL